jgi:hypothetical protein
VVCGQALVRMGYGDPISGSRETWATQNAGQFAEISLYPYSLAEWRAG